jgi:hypothetical protein
MERSRLFRSFGRTARNKVAFHYDRDHVRQSLADVTNESSEPLAKITLGTDYYLSRFNLADTLMDSIVVRQVMRIPRCGNVDAFKSLGWSPR